MSKKLFVLAMLLVASVAFANEMFLVEDSGDKPVVCSNDGPTKFNELEFSLTSPAYVIISSSSVFVKDSSTISADGATWVLINNDTLLAQESYGHPLYMTWLDKGTYKIESWAIGCWENTSVTLSPPSPLDSTPPLPKPLLQVMVFLQDSTSSVCEPPQSNNPSPTPRSILATGNIVHVEGCSEIYDISGKKVDCSITNGDIQLNSFPAGTYFAKGGEGSTTKIVKSY